MWKPLLPAVFAMGLTTLCPNALFWPVLIGFILTALCARHHWGIASLAFLVFFCGLITLHTHRTMHSASLARQVLQVHGHIIGLPVVKPRATRFDFHVDAPSPAAGTLRLSWYKAPPLRPGDVYQLTVKIHPARNYGNPGHFDYVAHLQHQGIVAIGYVKKGEYQASAPSLTLLHPNQWRWQIRNYLQHHVPKSALGWISALLIGDQSLLTSTQWQLLQESGTVHLFVVSGLHIGLAAALGGLLGSFVFMLFSPWQRVNLLSARIFCALVFAGTYALLAGFGIPVQRALIMLFVGLIGYRLGLRPSPASMLVFAFLWVTLTTPGWEHQHGLWLSFAAVAGILLTISGRGPLKKKPLHQWLSVQWAVFWILMPFLLFFGQAVAWLSPLLNMILIPITSFFLLPGLLLTLLLSWGLGFSLDSVWQLWGTVFQALEWVLTWVAHYHWTTLPSGAPLWSVILAILGACLLMLPGSLFRIAGICAMLPLWFPVHATLPYGSLRVVFFDVGQGLSVWVATQKHHLLFDTGDRYDSFVVADQVVIPWLYHEGIHKLDRLVISHKDSDHAGGMSSVIQHLRPRSVLTGYATGASSCHHAPAWKWDGIKFQFLALPDELRHTGNEQSCVLLIEQDHMRVLLTGDITRKIEHQLVIRFAKQLDVDVLQVPHHGSRTSSSTDFLQALSPRWSIISSGFHNRFGHPHPNVVKRLQTLSNKVFNTATQGAISILAYPNQSPRISTYYPSSK